MTCGSAPGPAGAPSGRRFRAPVWCLVALLLPTLAGCPAPLGPCPTPEEFYVARVDSLLLDSCADCHRDGGAADRSGFFLDGDRAARFAAAAARASAGGPVSLLLSKPSNTHADGHGGGLVLRADSDDYALLAEFAGRQRGAIEPCGEGVASADPCAGVTPGPRLLRRLAHVEYGNTVRDLLGLTSRPEAGFAADDAVDGYRNDAGALDLSPLLLEQVRDAAEELSAAAVAQNFDALMPCAESTTACAGLFVERFGRRVFRRPLTEDDRARYLAVFLSVAPDEGFRAGIRWVIAALLQSPHFLYRSELGQRDGGLFALDPFERATELSYLALRTTPDEALLDAAAAGELETVEGLRTQLDRLLATGAAADTMVGFVEEWLLLDRLPIVVRDAAVYAELTDAVRADLAGEARRLVTTAMAEGASLADLLRGDATFLTPALAAFYDVPLGDGPADAEGFVRTSLAGTGRGGLLTLGALLTVHALPTGSSPIHRGVLVRERLLCEELPPPPPNVDASPPPLDPALSTRDRYAAHSALPECAACHDRIDPLGFAFEHFDGVGRWRDTDGPHDIDATGQITGTLASDGAFDGAIQLQALLADSPDVLGCYATQWLRFGTGLGDALACSVSALDAFIAADGGRLDAVFAGIVGLPHFTTRTGGPDELDAPAVGPGVLPPILGDTEFPDGGDDNPGGTEGLSTEVTLDDWGTGYCATVLVTNEGASAVLWAVVLAFDGVVGNFWNTTMTPLPGGQYAFVGAGWNDELAAGATVEFGLCATR